MSSLAPITTPGSAVGTTCGSFPGRSAWVEIDVARLRQNFALIRNDLPPGVGFLSVVKDAAYGHGAVVVARAALEAGAVYLGANTPAEAIELREAGITAPILMLGERYPVELPACVQHRLTLSVGELEIARRLSALATAAGRRLPIHLKIDTGMSRFGVRWDSAAEAAAQTLTLCGLEIEGVMSHFAMSDETDKTFARTQLSRFKEVLAGLEQRAIRTRWQHACNSGGLLDLPEAHFNLVRTGILPLGVFPSAVCRRIVGIQPVMSVKARIVSLHPMQEGDTYGYGMRYRAESARRVAVLPVGYGDGFPRLRNEGYVLVRGKRAPILGSVAMDSMGIDVTALPQAQLWDEVVIMGCQGDEEISAHDVARWKRSVSYEIITGWRSRLPRVCVNNAA